MRNVQWLSVLAVAFGGVGLLLSFFMPLPVVVAAIGLGVISALLSLKE